MRTPRLNAPGAVFHVVSRTQGKAHWLTRPVQRQTLVIFRRIFEQSDVRVFAFALMTNHLHLLVEQGNQPLSRFCQLLLHRIAITAQRAHGLEGHVFERRYRAKLCADAHHVRNALVYIHLNAWDAGLCVDPCEYPWHSHHLYLPGAPASLDLAIPAADVLRLFKRSACESIEQARANYLAHAREVMGRRKRGESDEPGSPPDATSPLWYPAADVDWGKTLPLGADVGQSHNGNTGYDPRALTDVAVATAKELAPNLDFDTLLSRRGGRTYSKVRRAVIARLHQSGHRSIEIARFLNLSPSRVSRVIAECENRRPGP